MSLLKISRAAQRVTRPLGARSFHWDKAVYAYTDPETIQMYRNWQNQIDSMRAKTGAEQAVQPIDFAQWKKVIKTPGVVDQIQKEYESIQYTDLKPDFLADFNKRATDMIKEADTKAESAKAGVEPLKAELAKRRWIRDHWWALNIDEVLSLFPGAREEADANYFQGNFASTYDEDTLEDSLKDMSVFRERLSKGQALNFPEMFITMVEEKDKIEPYFTKEEMEA